MKGTVCEEDVKTLEDKAFEPGIGFEGLYPIPYSFNFSAGVKAGWKAALIAMLRIAGEHTGREAAEREEKPCTK